MLSQPPTPPLIKYIYRHGQPNPDSHSTLIVRIRLPMPVTIYISERNPWNWKPWPNGIRIKIEISLRIFFNFHGNSVSILTCLKNLNPFYKGKYHTHTQRTADTSASASVVVTSTCAGVDRRLRLTSVEAFFYETLSVSKLESVESDLVCCGFFDKYKHLL